MKYQILAFLVAAGMTYWIYTNLMALDSSGVIRKGSDIMALTDPQLSALGHAVLVPFGVCAFLIFMIFAVGAVKGMR